MSYTELQVTTNFSFLRGASHPEEMVEQAFLLGYKSIAVTDVNTLAGIVRAYAACKKFGIRLITGCHLQFVDGTGLLVYPVNKKGYSELCELLTTGNLRTEKGQCLLYKQDAFDHLQNAIAIALPPAQLDEQFKLSNDFKDCIKEYKKHFRDRLYMAIQRRYRGDDAKLLHRVVSLATNLQIPVVATNDVYYHIAERRQLQDVLACIREKCNIYNAGFRLYANAERYLKPEAEIKRLFRQYPVAVEATIEIVQTCNFSLDELQYEYPEELTSEERTPQQELEYQVWKGAAFYFGNDVPQKTKDAILYELNFIEKMDYASYFLTVFDIVRYARSRDILCQGRGSAANSTVCYCLGITSVNPLKFELLFERFLSTARNEPPDIDVDFEHERREEVIQYIYEKYGRDRAAIVATVTQQHQRGAIRDVAKAMGLSLDMIEKISSSIINNYGHEPYHSDSKTSELGLQPGDKHLQKVFNLTNQFIGFPRQLGQHTGGFVISREKLSQLCPVLNARMENRTCIEWNKDDIDVLKFLKVDILALGMLTCISKSFQLVKEYYRLDWTLANVPQDDPAVYDMICRADTIGVFQIESRAQQSMLPRLKPSCFYDLVIEVAIVRPGPIQGDMVHPYLRRRNGEEKIEYPSKELEEILGRTLGVPLFQEQAMKVAIVAAGFTPTEADELRRSMATFKAKGMVTGLEKKLINGMIAKGYTPDYAHRIFRQLEGFGSYGFPESHAASFAQLVYVSSWIKCHYPDVFACALLNSLPMGFYQPAQIIIDAEKHGVSIKPIDINFSDWDNKLQENNSKYKEIRLGFRNVKGLRREDIMILIEVRLRHQFHSIFDVFKIGLSESALERIADSDAFRSIGLDRRQALWQISIKDKPNGIFINEQDTGKQEGYQLPLMPLAEHVLHDYAITSLSVKAHPLKFLRGKLTLLNITATNRLKEKKNGDYIKVAGLVLVRQHPETSKGVWFITIEDETGMANLVAFPNINKKFRKEIVQSRLLMVEGKLQVEGLVIHVVIQKCYDISRLLGHLSDLSIDKDDMPQLSRSDVVKHPKPYNYSEKSFGKSRNFR